MVINKLKANKLNKAQFQKAFTILELIIVFFFFALISGIALPNLTRAYDSWQRRLVTDDLILNINRLNLFALEQEKTIVLTDSTPLSHLPFEIPENYQMIIKDPIYFYPNGVCSGGTMSLKSGNFESHYELQAPYCTPKKI